MAWLASAIMTNFLSASAGVTPVVGLLALGVLVVGAFLFLKKKGGASSGGVSIEASVAAPWLAGLYGVWSGKEDSGTWPKETALSYLSEFYGIHAVEELDGMISQLVEGSSGRVAWDVGRAADLLRIGVAAGFYTDAYCWNQCPRLAEKLGAQYGSWKAYAAAYEFGMHAWQARCEIDDPEELNRVRKNLPLLEREVWPQTPWRFNGISPEPRYPKFSSLSAETRVIRSCPGASLVEDDGELEWRDLWNRRMPVDAWEDEWGPVPRHDLATFLHHRFSQEELVSGDPEGAEKVLQSFGYRDMGHFFQVEGTIVKHFSEPTDGTDFEDFVLDSQKIAAASPAALVMGHEAVIQVALKENPTLLDPVEGIDLATYAAIEAKASAISDQGQLNAFLSKHGLDLEAKQRVASVWQERIGQVPQGALGTQYSEYFTAALQDVPQVASAVTPDSGTTGDGAPMSLELFSEVAGAMTAWGQTGQDMGAMLQHSFQLTMVDYSNGSMFWTSRFSEDLALMQTHNELREKYAAEYLAAAGANASPDADIAF